MNRTTRRTATIKALGTDGEEYTIYEYTEFIETITHGEGRSEMAGMKELKTSDGRSVNYVGKGQYKVVQTGVLLRSDSPDAP